MPQTSPLSSAPQPVPELGRAGHACAPERHDQPGLSNPLTQCLPMCLYPPKRQQTGSSRPSADVDDDGDPVCIMPPTTSVKR